MVIAPGPQVAWPELNSRSTWWSQGAFWGEREMSEKAALVKPFSYRKQKPWFCMSKSHRAELGHEDSYTNGLVEGKWVGGYDFQYL